MVYLPKWMEHNQHIKKKIANTFATKMQQSNPRIIIIVLLVLFVLFFGLSYILG